MSNPSFFTDLKNDSKKKLVEAIIALPIFSIGISWFFENIYEISGNTKNLDLIYSLFFTTYFLLPSFYIFINYFRFRSLKKRNNYKGIVFGKCNHGLLYAGIIYSVICIIATANLFNFKILPEYSKIEKEYVNIGILKDSLSDTNNITLNKPIFVNFLDYYPALSEKYKDSTITNKQEILDEITKDAMQASSKALGKEINKVRYLGMILFTSILMCFLFIKKRYHLQELVVDEKNPEDLIRILTLRISLLINLMMFLFLPLLKHIENNSINPEKPTSALFVTAWYTPALFNQLFISNTYNSYIDQTTAPIPYDLQIIEQKIDSNCKLLHDIIGRQKFHSGYLIKNNPEDLKTYTLSQELMKYYPNN